MDMKFMLAAEGDRKVGYRTAGFRDTPVLIEVRDLAGRGEFAYLTPEMALELADFILANVERPKPKTAADQIRELPIGGKFRFTDSHDEDQVNVKVTDEKFWHSTAGMFARIGAHEYTSYGIEVIE